jgi:oligosaccharide reducing-end xylanase
MNFFLRIWNCKQQGIQFLLYSIVCLVLLSCSDETVLIEAELQEIETISTEWEVATWYDFKKAVISHTWDDNTRNQLSHALPLYNEFGFKASFFITAGWSPDWSGFRTALLQGHEVSSHTMTHPYIYSDSIVENRFELGESRRMIIENMQTKYPMTFAYPYCYVEDIAMMEDYYIAARGCSNEIVPNVIENFMNIGSFIGGTSTQYQTAADFNEIAEKALVEDAWSVYTFHTIDDPTGWSPITSEDLRSHLEYLKTHDDLYWVDTFINVVKYAKERQAVEIIPTENANGTISALITDGLQNNIYNAPLTFKKEIPSIWPNCKIYQGSRELSYQTLVDDSKTYVIFNAIPDRGEVRIERDF